MKGLITKEFLISFQEGGSCGRSPNAVNNVIATGKLCLPGASEDVLLVPVAAGAVAAGTSPTPAVQGQGRTPDQVFTIDLV